MSGQGHGQHWGLWSALSPGTKANTSLVCHSFKFLQVKNHVSLSVIVSTLGQFRITSSDATHSNPFWNSETLTRLDFSVFQKQVWKISPGTARERMLACLFPSSPQRDTSATSHCKLSAQTVTSCWWGVVWGWGWGAGEEGGHVVTLGIGYIIPPQIPGGDWKWGPKRRGDLRGSGARTWRSVRQVHPLPHDPEIIGSSPDMCWGESREKGV